jgi:DNA repair protein RecO (recombination protein O)
MNWDDKGFLLSKTKYNENSLIVEIYTKNHGKIPGIIFGGTSKKIKNYLQIGNKLHVNFNSKSDTKIGYFKIEIEEALVPFYFDDNQKLSCISSAISLIKLLSAEYQKNKFLYSLIDDFFILLKNDNWIKNYIFWELELLKVVGYELKFENLVDEKMVGNELIYFSKSTTDKKTVPNFLIDKTSDIESISSLLEGLKIIGDYLDKTILKPNNINHPFNRSQFINTLR